MAAHVRIRLQWSSLTAPVLSTTPLPPFRVAVPRLVACPMMHKWHMAKQLASLKAVEMVLVLASPHRTLPR